MTPVHVTAVTQTMTTMRLKTPIPENVRLAIANTFLDCLRKLMLIELNFSVNGYDAGIRVFTCPIGQW